MPTRFFSSLFATACLLVLNLAVSNAQWTIGLRGGPNLTNANVMARYGTRAHTGGIVGGNLTCQLNAWSSIGFQPQYIAKGITLNRPYFASDAEWVTPDLRYIEVPVIVEAGMNFGNIGVDLFAGVDPGILVSGRFNIQKWNSEVGRLQTVETRDPGNRLLPYDFAIDYGLGLSYRISPTIILTADLRKSQGLVNVIQQDPADPIVLGISGYSYRSSDVKLLGGIMFTL